MKLGQKQYDKMNLMLRIYKPLIEDISQFEKLNEANLKQLLSYSDSSLKIIFDAINRCDSKAIAQIPFILTLYGAYGVWVKNCLVTDISQKYIFYINTMFVLLILFLCFMCLWVRVLKTQPPISNILAWIKNEPNDTLEKRLIPTILLKVAEAEFDNYRVLGIKSNILKISQGVIFITIALILIGILLSI